MIDWSVTANIIFVAAVGVALLFTLVSAIAVIAKGKRKCRAVDVILRIVATLCFIGAAALAAAAVLTMLSGDVRIDVSDAPVLVFNDKTIQLPLADMFVALSTTFGSNLVTALTVTSLMLLIVDCLLANKSDKKQKAESDKKSTKKAKDKAVKNKSPEQLKREAELEKIRRLGANAVRSASAAADTVKDTAEPSEPITSGDKAVSERSCDDEGKNEATFDPSDDVLDDSALGDKNDWRASDNTAGNAEFVGLRSESDPEFDTFGDFENDEQTDGLNPHGEEQDTETQAESFDGEPNAEQEQEQAMPQNDDAQEYSTEESDAYDYGEEPRGDGVNYSDESDFVSARTDKEELDAATDDGAEESGATEKDGGEAGDDVYDDASGWAFDSDVSADYETAYDDAQEKSEAKDEAAESTAIYGDERLDEEIYDDRSIEPNRDIYIPKMRTIVVRKQEEKPKTASERTAPAASKAKGRTAQSKPRAAAAAAKPSPAAKKPAVKKQSDAAARSKASNAAEKRAAQKPADDDTKKRDGKKLPVTRRYVILDRTSAVNIFGNYLKERDDAEKNKLENSISTIIIK